MPASLNRPQYYTPGIDVRCPSCGGAYDRDRLRLREGNTRGLPICDECALGGPDGDLERREK